MRDRLRKVLPDQPIVIALSPSGWTLVAIAGIAATAAGIRLLYVTDPNNPSAILVGWLLVLSGMIAMMFMWVAIHNNSTEADALEPTPETPPVATISRRQALLYMAYGLYLSLKAVELLHAGITGVIDPNLVDILSATVLMVGYTAITSHVWRTAYSAFRKKSTSSP